jgi:hypothetical protein
MPNLIKHRRSSISRTGKDYKELHKWMDKHQKELGIEHRKCNHNVEDIPYVEKRWGEEGVKEFLIHIAEDYKDTNKKLEKIYHSLKNENERLRQAKKFTEGYEARYRKLSISLKAKLMKVEHELRRF